MDMASHLSRVLCPVLVRLCRVRMGRGQALGVGPAVSSVWTGRPPDKGIPGHKFERTFANFNGYT